MKYNNIKKIYLIFISFWIVSFLFNFYLIIPNTDDAYYLMPAIGYLNTNELAYHIEDYQYKLFERFPLYSFIQGNFFKIINPLININFYTYRTLNILVFISILILSFFLLKKILDKDGQNFNNKIIFLPLILSFTPIQTIIVAFRPELLGILFVLISIFFLYKKEKKLFYLSGFFLGLAVICHPVFVIFNLFLVIYSFLILKNYKKIFLYLTINSIPFFILIFYLYLNLPNSLEMFTSQAKNLPYFKAWYGLISYSFDLIKNESFLIGSINTIFYMPPFIFMLICIKYFFSNTKKKFFKDKLIFLLFLSTITILILERNHTYLISLSSFFIIFIIFYIPWSKKILNFVSVNNKSINLLFVLLALIIINSWNIIHFSKFNLYKDKYLEPSKFIKFKKEITNDSSAIVIARPELVPLFTKELNQQYITNEYNHFWFFPDNSPPRNVERIAKSENLIKQILETFTNKKIVWAVAKKDFKKKNNKYCLRLDDTHSSHSVNIQFDDIHKLLETNKHIFYYANNYANNINLNCR